MMALPEFVQHVLDRTTADPPPEGSQLVIAKTTGGEQIAIVPTHEFGDHDYVGKRRAIVDVAMALVTAQARAAVWLNDTWIVLPDDIDRRRMELGEAPATPKEDPRHIDTLTAHWADADADQAGIHYAAVEPLPEGRQLGGWNTAGGDVYGLFVDGVRIGVGLDPRGPGPLAAPPGP